MSYIKEVLSPKSIQVLYNANRVRYDRCQLYGEFVTSLMWLMLDTYLGDEFTGPKQQIEHFNWCWKTNLVNFDEEGIEFKDDDDLYKYFMSFAVEMFYANPKKDCNETIEELVSIWREIFDYTNPKSRGEVDSFVELYNMFEKAL